MDEGEPVAAFDAPRLKPVGEMRLAENVAIDAARDALPPAPTITETAGDAIAELAWTATADASNEAIVETRNVESEAAPTSAASSASYGLYLRDCLDCPDLAEIDAGTLAPEPNSDLAVPLMLRKPIAVSVYETTFADWSACVSDGACPHISDNGWGGGDRPVVNVTYNEAQAYADWLSRKSGRTYRLPTETEWEYAARAGSLAAFSFGSAEGSGKANFASANGRTMPVGRYAPNLFGLFDMHGNVAEWTADCWTGGEGATLVGSFCSAHVVKGGGWDSLAETARASARDGAPTGARRSNVGFRVVRDLR